MIILFIVICVAAFILAWFITPRFENDPEGRAKFLENL